MLHLAVSEVRTFSKTVYPGAHQRHRIHPPRCERCLSDSPAAFC